MVIDFASLVGKRDSNEDKHTIIKNIDGSDTSMCNINLYAVFDGHGGKFVSKFLSDYLFKFYMNNGLTYPLRRQEVNKAYEFFQNKLKTDYNENTQNTGSTALVVSHYLKGGSEFLNIANLGDCRCVICNNNIAIPLTKDHKPNKPEEEYRIKKLGGQIYYDGYDWRIGDLSVSRAFGDISNEPYISFEPDLFEYTIGNRDKFLIIGCDGLWDAVDNQEAVDFILSNCYDMGTGKRKKNTHNKISKKLGEFAIEKGSTDNVSIIVVFF